MTPIVGFILLTHNKPHQIVRLVSTLNRMFDYPPIVCHHDFSKSDLPINGLTGDVSFVHPHLQTGWGNFSLIEAMLLALQTMYKAPISPDWFILLSAADYPVKPAKQILDDLASSPYDVHIHHEQINYNDYKRDWQRLCYARYCAIKFWVPSLNRKLHLINRQINIKHPVLTAPFLPFSENFRCFAGEQWFCANRKAAKYLIEFHTTKPALASHYRRFDSHRMCPDESYYQTVFCNAPHLKISNNNWRYTDWSIGGAHPKTLRFEDLPNIYASSAHFARKFDMAEDDRILEELDAIVG